jgi:hypothetical protein
MSHQEEAFCRAWVEPIDRRRLTSFYLLVLVFHAFMICAELLVQSFSNLVPMALSVHCLTLPILLFGLVKRKNIAVYRNALRAAGCAVLIALDIFLIYTAKHWINRPEMLLVLSFHIITGMLFPHIDRLSRPLAYTTLCIHIGGTWAALGVSPLGFIAATVVSVAYFFSTMLAFINQQNEWRVAQAEFRFRANIVPEHIVRHSANSTVDVTELFKPSQKFCVCLSSDWRNYQAISVKIPTTQLTASLNEYHQWCQNLARDSFPDGNYYTDWIADELFIVAYANETSQEKDLVNRMMQFAINLAKFRPEFTRIHGIPQAIDIGISAGPALVGVMGPQSHLKATALGEIPGRARRLQTAGKLLRERLGDNDRLILSREVLMGLVEPLDVLAFHLDPSESIRDLIDREIFYVNADFSKKNDQNRIA